MQFSGVSQHYKPIYCTTSERWGVPNSTLAREVEIRFGARAICGPIFFLENRNLDLKLHFFFKNNCMQPTKYTTSIQIFNAKYLVSEKKIEALIFAVFTTPISTLLSLLFSLNYKVFRIKKIHTNRIHHWIYACVFFSEILNSSFWSFQK
jgi:hypothetical protein